MKIRFWVNFIWKLLGNYIIKEQKSLNLCGGWGRLHSPFGANILFYSQNKSWYHENEDTVAGQWWAIHNPFRNMKYQNRTTLNLKLKLPNIILLRVVFLSSNFTYLCNNPKAFFYLLSYLHLHARLKIAQSTHSLLSPNVDLILPHSFGILPACCDHKQIKVLPEPIGMVKLSAG